MKPRDLVCITALLALVGAAGVIVLGGASPVEGAALAPVETEPSSAAAASSMMAAQEQIPATMQAAPARESHPDVTSTDGVIRGHISLSPAVSRQLKSVNVTILEAFQGPGEPPHTPFQVTHVEPIGPNLGTPRFIYTDIPFSEFGYFIKVWAEDVNGSRQFKQLNRDAPVADVILSVTEGVPFSVLLRDQVKMSLGKERVFMVPVGQPLGRKLQQQETDSFGAAVFENVLQGEYEIRVGAMNSPTVEPSRVLVQMHSGVRSTTLEVPRGFKLEVRAEMRGGYGIEGARIRMLATDSINLRELKAATDWGGRHVFPSVLPGTYQVDIRADDYHVVTRKVVVAKDHAPNPLVVLLTRRNK